MSNTKLSDISRDLSEWDGKNSPEFTTYTLKSWFYGCTFGFVMAIILTLAAINIFDPPCTMMQIYKVCKTHSKTK